MATWDDLFVANEVLKTLASKTGTSYVLVVSQDDPKTGNAISRSFSHIRHGRMLPMMEQHTGEFYEELYEEHGYPPRPDLD